MKKQTDLSSIQINLLKYNYHTNRVTPSSQCVLSFTLLLIIVPTSLCLVVTICLSENFPIWLKVVLAIVLITSVSLSLWSLYQTSTTDPGVILPTQYIE